MSTLTDNWAVPATASDHIRSFDIRKDLGQVADLVERCFYDTLDPDGERYLQQMRSAANNPGFLRWAAAAADWASLPMSGYVWEENGRLVGNASLIPYNLKGRRNYLIANVAVHPDYRRRGIARALTVRAMIHAQQHGAPSVWLHVRENNEGAVRLYQQLGFDERARRTTWYNQPNVPEDNIVAGVNVIPRLPRYWEAQRRWLRQNYPSELTWHLPLNLKLLRPGLLGILYRILSSTIVSQWAAVRNGKLLGVLTWQASSGYANNLWLAAPPETELVAAQALLLHARRHLSPRRPLQLDYPALRASAAIEAAGFFAHHTLIWMSASLTDHR